MIRLAKKNFAIIGAIVVSAALVLVSVDATRQNKSLPSPAMQEGPATAAAAQTGNLPANKETAAPKIARNSNGIQTTVGDTIAIPSLGATIPIVSATTTNAAALHSLLDQGVVLYPGSVDFGQIGQTILLGHSAPDNWPKIKYNTAFSRINELNSGDKIKISRADHIFTFQVVRTQIIDKGANLFNEDPGKNWLLLVSCWPPGHNRQRIVVESVLE